MWSQEATMTMVTLSCLGVKADPATEGTIRANMALMTIMVSIPKLMMQLKTE